jgi:DnaJ-class molecular chaperone
MQCIVCKGEGTKGAEQTEICDNCFGSGEIETKKGA